MERKIDELTLEVQCAFLRTQTSQLFSCLFFVLIHRFLVLQLEVVKRQLKAEKEGCDGALQTKSFAFSAGSESGGAEHCDAANADLQNTSTLMLRDV